MAKFGEEIRCVLADVAEFLHVTLKNVLLPSGARTHRQQLISKLESLQETYPQLYWELTEQLEDSCQDLKPQDQTASDTSVTKTNVSGDIKSPSAVNNGQQQLPLLVSPEDLTAPAMSGFLNRKTRFLIARSRKMWCVVKNGIFYAFEKETSKTQLLSFPLQGTEAKTLPPSKNEYCFELRQGTDKYTFSVGNHMEMNGWISALTKEAQTVPEERLSVCYTSPDYYDGSSSPVCTKTNHGNSPPAADGLLYEETNITKPAPQTAAPDIQTGSTPAASPMREAASSTKPEHVSTTETDVWVSQARSSVTVPPPRPAGNTRPQPQLPETSNDLDGIYDEVRSRPVPASSQAINGSVPPLPSPRHHPQLHIPDVKSERTDGDRTGPPTNNRQLEDSTSVTDIPPSLPRQRREKSPNHAEPKAVDSSREQRDDVSSDPAARNAPDGTTSAVARADELPPVKRASVRKPRLPAPSPATRKVSSENLYVACWDCTADADNELTFKKGDLLVIISREYESAGWWIGQLSDNDGLRRIGLVPKDYLTKQLHSD